MSVVEGQECLCSLGLVQECPAHPFRQRPAQKPKPSRQALKAGECAACVFIKPLPHPNKRHKLVPLDVKTALELGPVFCVIPALSTERLVVRGVRKKDFVLQVETLEGWHDPQHVSEMWMDAL